MENGNKLGDDANASADSLGTDNGADEMSFANLAPPEGSRSMIVGMTGSGKTAFARWLLMNMDFSPFIIYDTKIEPKFASMPNAIIVSTVDECAEAVENPEVDFIVFRPSTALRQNADALDALLEHHLEYWQNVGCYIDEVYQFHKNGRAGPGLTGMLTRGRSKGITVVMSTQRPAWISLFCLTESERFYLFYLNHKKDRKRMDDVIEGFSEWPAIKHGSHQYYYYTLAEPEPRLMDKIPLDAEADTGYVDPAATGAKDSRKLLWV